MSMFKTCQGAVFAGCLALTACAGSSDSRVGVTRQAMRTDLSTQIYQGDHPWVGFYYWCVKQGTNCLGLAVMEVRGGTATVRYGRTHPSHSGRINTYPATVNGDTLRWTMPSVNEHYTATIKDYDRHGRARLVHVTSDYNPTGKKWWFDLVRQGTQNNS